MLFTDARNIGFRAETFDIVLSGFMGWDDCFDFARNQFTRPDTKITEIHRVLREGGRFICCSWEAQEDLAWMEAAMLRHNPALLDDAEYLQHRPVGMSLENVEGYACIFQSAGFHELNTSSISADFYSTDEEEWWREMEHLGWELFLNKIKNLNPSRYVHLKKAILSELEGHRQVDGIHFVKSAFYVSGVK